VSPPRGPKQTKPPFGNSPSVGGRALPLVTQPMIAIEPPADGGGIDGPTVSAVFGKSGGQGPTGSQLPGGAGMAAGPAAIAAAAASPMRGPMPALPTVSFTVAQPGTVLAPALGGAPGSALATTSNTPTEVHLTQHHLNGDRRPDARLALVIDADSEQAAAFRVLRHHLLEVGRPQVVIVTSPIAGEGKTTVAINLALALAECGRAKVLLAETHVRRPQLAGVFDMVPPWCFAEQLAAHRHQPMLPWSLVEIPSMWLHVAAINPQIERSQLLDAPAFAIAMERLRLAGYEHIVIDAPPVLGSADVNLMADAADAVLFAVRSKRTTARNLRKAVDQLGSGKVAGSVLVTD
jgi:Mrp family chromosome partitioning ATPase